MNLYKISEREKHQLNVTFIFHIFFFVHLSNWHLFIRCDFPRFYIILPEIFYFQPNLLKPRFY